MKKYNVVGKQWFDRANGNKYCAARIYDINGNEIARLPYEYGGGDYYLQNAREWLAKNVDQNYGKKVYSDIFAIMQKVENCKKAEVKEWGEK